MLASFALAAASATNYRLAGIVASGSGGSIALIELPDGRQRLFRTGDALGDGTIGEITPIGVRISLANEDLLLRLRGNPMLAVSPRTESPSAGDETDLEQSTVRNQEISVPEAARLLASAEGARQPQTGAQASSAETPSQPLNDMLEIPADARIVAVDQVSVETPRDAIEAVVSHLEESHAARLTVTGAGDLQTIVLTSDSEQ